MHQVALDERGTSPVIGAILMFGITVILAAVIGSCVLGFEGGGGSGDVNTTCVGHCDAVESVEVDPASHTDVEVVFGEPVTASVVIYADGEPLSEETLDGERLLTTDVNGWHDNVTVDVHREGVGEA